MEKSPNAPNAEPIETDSEKGHIDTRRHWLRIAVAIGSALLLIGAAIAAVIVFQSQASSITQLKHDKADMASQVTSSRSKTQKAERALRAITVQLANTKRSLAIAKRKAANQYFTGFSSGYSTGQNDSTAAYNDGYSSGYDAGYAEGLCVDPSTGGRVC